MTTDYRMNLNADWNGQDGLLLSDDHGDPDNNRNEETSTTIGMTMETSTTIGMSMASSTLST